jgi:hypothetical protein
MTAEGLAKFQTAKREAFEVTSPREGRGEGEEETQLRHLAARLLEFSRELPAF